MLYQELRRLGITRFILAIYSDDLGVASPGYNRLIRSIA
jgi:hypothetical protein